MIYHKTLIYVIENSQQPTRWGWGGCGLRQFGWEMKMFSVSIVLVVTIDFSKLLEVYTKSVFLYPNLNSVNKEMRKGKIYRSTEKNSYFSFWRLSAGFSLQRNKSMFIFYLYIFLSEILRNSKAEWKKRKKHVSDRGIHKLNSWDRRQNQRFTWGRSSTGPEEKGVNRRTIKWG